MKTPIRGFVRFGFGTWGRGACWAGAAIILLAAVGWGQEPTFNFGESPVSAKGYVNNLFQVDQFDNINLFNGNLMLNIPIGPKYTVGPNLSYQLKLVYNSKIWAFRHYYNCRVWCEMEPVGQCEIASIPDIICTPACDTCGVFAMRNTETNKELIGAFLKDYPSSGVGWTLHMGRIMSVKDLDKVYESPDGARHRIAEYQGDTGPDLSGYSYTNDGSYLRFNKPDTGPWEMWDAAGNHYIFGFSVDPDSPPDSTAAPHPDHSRNHDANHDKLLTYYLTEIDDPYGHWVKIAYQRVCKDTWEDGEIKRYYDALPTVMWDTTGRTITFNNQPEGEYWVTKAISIPNVSGQSSTYVLSYDAKAIFRARNDTVADASYCDDYPDSCDYFNDERRRFLPGVPLLASIALPVDIPNADSSTQTPLKYQFEYAQRDNYPYLIAPPDPSTEGYDYAQEPYELSGTLRKVVFPTGGQVQYLYKDRLQMTSSLGGGRSCENKYCQYLLEKSYFNNKFPPLAVATKTIQQSSQTWQYIERLLEDSDCEFIKWVNGIPYTRNYRYMVLDVVPPDDPFDKDGGYYRRHYFYMGYDDVLFGFTRKMETRRKSDNAVLVEQVHVPDWDHEQDDPGIIIVEGTPGSTNERNFCDLAVSTRYEDVDYNIRIQETRTTYSKSGRTSETTRSYSTDWDHFGHYEKEYHCESSSCTAPVLVETDFTPDAAAWILNKFNSVKKSMDPAVDKNILTAYVFDPLGRITDSCTFEDYINQAVTGCDMLWDLKRHYSYNTEGFLAGIDHLRMISGDSQLEYSEQVAYTCGIPAVKQFVGAPFKSLDRTIDCYTGLITAERDSAGIQTSLQYDALGRVLKILPSNGEAQTWVNYIDPNHTKVETRDGGELVHASDYYFDQLGRKTVTVRDNWSTGTGDQNYKSVMQVTSYSPQGKVFHTSEWLKATCDAATCPHLQAVTGDPPDPSNTSLKGTLNLDFDEQSRFTLQYRPNPSALRGYDDTTIIYDGITHKTVIESDVSGSTVDTDYTYDLLGRLIGVDDFLGGSAGYEYDHQDRLRKVTQWGRRRKPRSGPSPTTTSGG